MKPRHSILLPSRLERAMDINRFIFTELGLGFWPMVIPQKGIDLSKWAVIACDQYTSDKSYWESVSNFVGDSPSTLHCIFPEAYLSDDKPTRIKSIVEHMQTYLDEKLLIQLPPGFMYVERATPYHQVRKGIVCSIDLEQYDFNPGSNALIRATEKTILERIPPRVEIRKDAILEFPHILVLYTDKEQNINSAIKHRIQDENIQPLYDFELMKKGGRLKGYHLSSNQEISQLTREFEKLMSEDNTSMLFAVGDGNHSLATAKAIWTEMKQSLTETEQKDHPARFALVELVNINDPGLGFEPIHRVLLDTDCDKVIHALSSNPNIEFRQMVQDDVNAFKSSPEANTCLCISGDKSFSLRFKSMQSVLVIGELQKLLDKEQFPGELDYIHGFHETLELGSRMNAISFIVPPIAPEVLLSCVEKEGVLPRKTFSLGHAEEKRFYMEGKLIKKFPGGNK